MQTRLNEREQGLTDMLSKAVERGSVGPVKVDREDIRRWSQSVIREYRRLGQGASQSKS